MPTGSPQIWAISLYEHSSTLDPETVRALEAHLAGCQDCTAFINTYRGTGRSSRAISERQLPRELKERLLTFLRQETRR